MRQVESAADADAAVGYQVTTEERSSLQTVSAGWSGYNWNWNRGWHGSTMGTGMTTAETFYSVGTLIIALADVERDEMIFVGQGSKTLSSGNLSPEEQQKRIDEAVAKILEDFPSGSD
jgi:hypothetical protein